MMLIADYKILANEIDAKHGHKLNDWEINFLESVIKHMDEGKFLSQKQIKKLEQIYEKVTDV